ncbi:IS110 family transposase, partial [Parafrigoribacterium humi]|uniref:IS110 family transposase n=1 Tax=Parafrigoribacterium humi TaxID=3144664 RepID=UPI0032EEDD47
MLTTEPATGQATVVVAGVDTHKSTHHAAVLDLTGRILGSRQFPVNEAGYRQLLDWVASHGIIDRIGVELTGSYGAGLTRFLTDAGITVAEVNTTDKATRARRGKDDAIDAAAAGQKVLSGMATTIPKNTTGTIEAIRILTVVRDSAVKHRTQVLNQLKDLLITAPAILREQLDGMTLPATAKQARALHVDLARIGDPIQATKTAMKRLGERIHILETEITAADK